MRDELRPDPDPGDAVEIGLRTEVVAAHDELRADPSRAISSDELRSRLSELHEQQLAERDS